MIRTALDILTRWQDQSLQEKTAIIDGARGLTYAELLTAARQCGQRLKDAGLKKGDRVGIYLRRSVEAVAAFFGAYTAEAVPVFINEVLRPSQVNHILGHCEASALVTDGRQLLMLPDPAITPDRILNVDAQSASGSMECWCCRPRCFMSVGIFGFQSPTGTRRLPRPWTH